MGVAKAPKNTFGEAVVVNGETFDFKLADVYHKPTDPDEFFLPFRHSCGNNSFVAIGPLPFTLAAARKAVIYQVKHLTSIGTKWDRRKP